MPPSFQHCLKNAQGFIQDEVTSLKLAGQFLEQQFTQVLLNERANVEAAEERAKAAVAVAKAAVAEERAKAVVAEEQAKSANQLLQVKEEFYLKYEALRDTAFKNLNMDRLRARGLLSSRGVYEWYLRSVYNEHTPAVFGKTFIASTVCERLGILTSGLSRYFSVRFCEKKLKVHVFLGSNTAALQDIIKICLRNSDPNAPNAPSDVEVSNYARKLYGTLSNQIHGSPWEADFVELSDQLSTLDRCVVMGLCKDFGLL